MFEQIVMQVYRQASNLEYMFGLIQQESLRMNFFCERVGDTLVIWPKFYAQVNGIQELGETSVGIYAPIEVRGGVYTTSLWPLEALQHLGPFVSDVNPHSRKAYAIFNLKSDMPQFLQSKQYKAIRLGACVTEGQLLSPAFKPPSGIHTFQCTEMAIFCSAAEGKKLYDSLNRIILNDQRQRSGDFRVRIRIQKRLLWEMAVFVLFDQSEIDAVTKVINDIGLSWQSNILRHEVTSLHPDNKYLETINKGHARKYTLTGENSCSRNMLDLPSQFTAHMLQSATCGFDETVTMIGIPVPCLLPPLSEIIFAVLEEEEEFWKFMQYTSSERNMDDYDIFGIILSALVSK